MDLHRALLHDNSSYKVFVLQLDDTQIDQLINAMAKIEVDDDFETHAESPRVRSLLVINLIDLSEDYITALMDDIFLADRDRVVKYMATRPLKLGRWPSWIWAP